MNTHTDSLIGEGLTLEVVAQCEWEIRNVTEEMLNYLKSKVPQGEIKTYMLDQLSLILESVGLLGALLSKLKKGGEGSLN